MFTEYVDTSTCTSCIQFVKEMEARSLEHCPNSLWWRDAQQAMRRISEEELSLPPTSYLKQYMVLITAGDMHRQGISCARIWALLASPNPRLSLRKSWQS